MFETLSAEREVNVPASQAWGLYGGINLSIFLRENLPNLFEKIEVLEGDGGVGTVFYVTFPPGNPGFSYYKEKYTTMDNKQRVKESEIIEGGYLDLGFTFVVFRVEIIEKGEESCITKYSIKYKIKKEYADNASFISIDPIVMILETANSYLLKNKEISRTLPAEREVNVPASQAWELYGGINLSKFVLEYLPGTYEKVEVLEGDGGVGTVLNVVFPPGNPGFSYYKEKFTKIDNDKRVKESEIIEGGYLELGFTFVGFHVEIIEKCKESCITKFDTTYRIKEKDADKASLISTDRIIVILEAANNYLLQNKEISRTLPAEREVNVPASQAWELYGGINLSKFVLEYLPGTYEKVEVLEGDGGVGTILNVVFPPGNPGFSYYKEKFTKIDNDKRVKESEIIEGGYLELGFTFVGFHVEIIEKCKESCITKFDTTYRIKEKDADKASLISTDPIIVILEAANNYLLQNKEISRTLPAEREVNVPASQAWELYGGINLSKFVLEYLPGTYEKVEVLEGDGGVGTILNVVFPPGNPGFSYYKEKFTKIDNDKRVKESEIIEGGYLELGFTFVGFHVEIIEKCKESCITKFDTTYRIKEKDADKASLISTDPIIVILEAANSHLLKNKQV